MRDLIHTAFSNRWVFLAVGLITGFLLWPVLMVVAVSGDSWGQLGLLVLGYYAALWILPALLILGLLGLGALWLTARKDSHDPEIR